MMKSGFVHARLAAALVVIMFAPAQRLRAECIFRTTAERSSHAIAVFQGTVRAVTDRVPLSQVVSMDVERIWKGKVAKQVVLLNQITAEGFALERDKTYVVFTTPWRDDTIRLLGFQPSSGELFLSSACGNATASLAAARDGLIEQLGKWRVP